MTKQELIQRISSEWEPLLSALFLFDDEEKLDPHSMGGRSVKDVMGRVSGWESIALERLGRIKRREQIELIPDGQVEEWNRKFYELRRDWKLMIVEGEFENVHVRLMQEIERLEDAAWNSNESHVRDWLPKCTVEQYTSFKAGLKPKAGVVAKGAAR